jgi:hypothetical protein
MKNAVFCDVVGLLQTEVSEERVASIFRIEEIAHAMKSYTVTNSSEALRAMI